MLENDLIFSTFAEANLRRLDENMLKQYNEILQQPDPELFKVCLAWQFCYLSLFKWLYFDLG